MDLDSSFWRSMIKVNCGVYGISFLFFVRESSHFLCMIAYIPSCLDIHEELRSNLNYYDYTSEF